ncbi:MAG: hypothetical protein JNJ54_37040 [Myxococcaceae bacterium]|nr:hypothetical protein [Myxococcaceae bacterium]
MTKLLFLGSLACLGASGCVAHRSMLLPDERTHLTPEPFRLGDVSTSIQVRGSSGNLSQLDTSPLRAQVEERLRSTLGRGAAPNAPYTIDVEIDLAEEHGVGPGMAAGVATETGVLAVGATAGAVLGAIALPGVGAPLGAVVGVLAASPPALASAFAFDVNGVNAEYRAAVAVRRRSDRALVASRRVVAPWRASFSSYALDDRLARATGDAVIALEGKLVTALHEILAELGPTPAPQP